MYKIIYSNTAIAAIEKLNEKKKRQVKPAIDRISLAPEKGKPLTGPFKGLYTYRSGDYRIIYYIKFSEIKVAIVSVGHRSNVYKKLPGKEDYLLLNEQLLKYGTKPRKRKKKPR